MDEEQFKERIEHRDIVLDVRAILTTKSGQNFFKYIFKSYNVGEPPPQGIEGMLLHDMLGMWRAGNAIYKLVAEANVELAGRLLAEIEKERYDKLYAENASQPED